MKICYERDQKNQNQCSCKMLCGCVINQPAPICYMTELAFAKCFDDCTSLHQWLVDQPGNECVSNTELILFSP